LRGDYNSDGAVDTTDYVVWRSMFGQEGEWLTADGDGDGAVTEADYQIWRSNFGNTASSIGGASVSVGAATTLPEPAGILSWAIIVAVLVASRRHLAMAPRRNTAAR
jgi:hypothetical protein